MSKRVACYARVSTADQSTGLESQMRVLKQYCVSNEIDNVEYFADEGVSGTKASRPALDRLMMAVESDEISSVVVYSFSRFARSTTHLLQALQIFKRKGVHFVSLTEKIDTNSAVGVAIFSILAAISQLERDLIADRVRVGLANARAKGKLIGRKKMRDSDLIRKLLKAGMSYRNYVDPAVMLSWPSLQRRANVLSFGLRYF
jgi:DNA invertase Pin-like site-specific DNA recombinase